MIKHTSSNQTAQIRHREGQGRARKAMSRRARGGGPRRGIASLPVVVVACVLSFCVAVSATSAPKARTATTASVSKNLAKVVKAFSPATILYTGTSILTFKIFKLGGPIVNGIGFVDTLPSGPAYSFLSSTCVTASLPSSSTALTVVGVSLPAGSSSCLIRLRARQAPCGKFQNTAANVTGATNVNTSALNATLTVVGIPNGTTTGQCPPKVRKVFDPTTVSVGVPANLTFTISNPYTSTASGVGFTDTLPAGLSYSLITTTCIVTNLTGLNSNVLVVSGVTLAPGSSCQIHLTATSKECGTFTNNKGNITNPTNVDISALNATLGVIGGAGLACPKAVVTKSFSPSVVTPGSPSTLTFVITNPTSGPISNIGFLDSLPPGLSYSVTFTDCTTTTLAAGALTVSNVTLAAGASCKIVITVIGKECREYVNNSSNISNQSNVDTSLVNAVLGIFPCPKVQAVVTKKFDPTVVTPGAPSTLTFTITNPTSSPVSGIAFIDTLPLGLFYTLVSTTCVAAPTLGSSVLTVSGVSLAAGSTCTIVLSAASTFCGSYVNNSTNVSGVANVDTTGLQATLGIASSPLDTCGNRNGSEVTTTTIKISTSSSSISSTEATLPPSSSSTTTTKSENGSTGTLSTTTTRPEVTSTSTTTTRPDITTTSSTTTTTRPEVTSTKGTTSTTICRSPVPCQ